jgi:tetratricopeptide (TPR) repeat protein
MNALQRADQLRKNSRFADAAEAYQAALADGYVREAAFGLAHSLRMMGEFHRALTAYNGVIQREKDRTVRADALCGTALCLKALVRHGEALERVEKAAALYEATDDDAGLAYALWARATVLRVAGRLGEAEGSASEALGIYGHYGDAEGLTYCHCVLGGLARLAGDPDRSGEHYGEALALAEKRKDAFAVAYAHCGLGNVRRMKGQFKAALEQFERAEAGYRVIGDIVSYAYTLWSMGMTHLFLKHPKKAAERLDGAQCLFERTGDRRGTAYVHLARAQAPGADAAAELKAARALTRELDIPWEGLMTEAVAAAGKPAALRKLGPKIAALGSAWVPEGPIVNIP